MGRAILSVFINNFNNIYKVWIYQKTTIRKTYKYIYFSLICLLMGSLLINCGSGSAGGLGPAGPQGEQGLEGVQGIQGPGLTGEQGIQGVQGLNGEQGLQGTAGEQGIQGLGLTGEQGVQGEQGLQGIQGIQGIAGELGLQGIQGIGGEQGLQGIQGIAGEQGVHGEQGLTGEQGLQGIQGITGEQGLHGEQGLMGEQGVQGIQGSQGTAGEQGPPGADEYDRIVAICDLYVLTGMTLPVFCPADPADEYEPFAAICELYVQTGNTPPEFCNTSVETGKVVFASSSTYTGNLGGAAGADLICQSLADAAGLEGTFKAWISDDTSMPESAFTQYNEPYVLVNGPRIADNWNDLTDGTIINSISKDETGSNIQGWAWTNTNIFGNAYSGMNCSNWISSNPSDFGVAGIIGQVNGLWTVGGSTGTCDSYGHVYCFEQ